MPSRPRLDHLHLALSDLAVIACPPDGVSCPFCACACACRFLECMLVLAILVRSEPHASELSFSRGRVYRQDTAQGIRGDRGRERRQFPGPGEGSALRAPSSAAPDTAHALVPFRPVLCARGVRMLPGVWSSGPWQRGGQTEPLWLNCFARRCLRISDKSNTIVQ